jgi:hypothetical protein
MVDVIMKRQVTALIGRCYAGLDVADLRDEVLHRLRRIMSVDAAFFGTVDPQTLLFTSAVAEEPLGPRRRCSWTTSTAAGMSTSSPRWRRRPIRSARSTGPPAASGRTVPATGR